MVDRLTRGDRARYNTLFVLPPPPLRPVYILARRRIASAIDEILILNMGRIAADCSSARYCAIPRNFPVYSKFLRAALRGAFPECICKRMYIWVPTMRKRHRSERSKIHPPRSGVCWQNAVCALEEPLSNKLCYLRINNISNVNQPGGN